jgi:hypothetical protein
MPSIDPRKERTKNRARIAAFIAACTIVITTALFQAGPRWVLLAVGVAGTIAVAVSGDLPSDHGRGGFAKAPGLYVVPDIDREQRRKNRGRVGAFIGFAAMAISALFQPGWEWVPLAVGVSAGIAVAASADLARRRGRDSGLTGRALILLIRDGTVAGGRGSALTGPGHDDDEGSADPAAHHWRMLAMVSRLMPRPAGHRWLAEAEGLLSEIAPIRRGAAIRSYLLSAPWLAVLMWARAAQRRARLGPRRPG